MTIEELKAEITRLQAREKEPTMTDIPEDVMKLARNIARDVFANSIDSDDDSHSMDMPVATNIIAAAITADRETRGDGWMDIETAPKDGTRLLLMWESFSGVFGRIELGQWRVRYGWVNTYGHTFTGAPSHYMPLPSPPSEGRE